MRLCFSILASCLVFLSACSKQSDPTKLHGVIQLSEAYSATFDLVDHYGKDATDERFRGKPMLIYIGFATCSDACPIALGVMSATLDEMGKDAGSVQPLFITMDPERDDAEALAALLSFDERILGLTGTKAQTDALIKGLKLYTQRVEMPDSALEYQFDHQSMFFYVDAGGNPQYALLDSIDPKDIATFLKNVDDAS